MKRIFFNLSAALAVSLLFNSPTRAQQNTRVVESAQRAGVSQILRSKNISSIENSDDRICLQRTIDVCTPFFTKEKKNRTVVNSTPKVKIPFNASAVENKTFYGLCLYSREWKKYQYGVYSFTTSDLNKSLIHQNTNDLAVFRANAGGAYFNNALHYFTYNSNVITYYEWDTDSWTLSRKQVMPDWNFMARSSAYDPVTKKVYGCYLTDYGNDMQFGEADYKDLTQKLICHLDTTYVAMACSQNGTLYAVSEGGNLYTLNKQTGVATLIGATGVKPTAYAQGMAFDYSTGCLYWIPTVANDVSGLFTIDTNTGRATELAEFPNNEEITCLYFPFCAAENAPAEVTDISTSFDKALLTGTVSFKLPAVNVAGENISGKLDYIITEDEDTLARGTADAGTVAQASITVTNGKNKINIQASNDSGYGPRSIYSFYAGYDVPRGVNVTQKIISQDEGKYTINISWGKPDKGMYNGYMDTENITYDVVRYPENDTIAKGLTVNEYEDILNVVNMKSIYYGIVVHNGTESCLSKSNTLAVGDHFDVPYFEDFLSKNDFNLFTVIDYDGSKPWKYVTSNGYEAAHAAKVSSNFNKDNDDWLITPPIKLSTDYMYELSFRLCSPNAYKPEVVEVAMGYDNKNPRNYKVLMDNIQVSGYYYTSYSVPFVVDHDGNAYIGFHYKSPIYRQSVILDSIQVVAISKATAPDSVTNLKVVPGDEGDLCATISFNAPAKTIKGGELNGISKIEIYRDGQLINTLNDVTPGSAQRVKDESDDIVNGTHEYSLYSYNEDGKGNCASSKVFIGIDTPLQPSNLHAKDNNDGTVTLTWNAPSAIGVNGGYVDVDALTYDISDNSGAIQAENISGTTATIKNFDITGSQGQEIYTVAAKNEAGSSSKTASNLIIRGACYNLPFVESFTNGSLDYGYWYAECNIGTKNYWGTSSMAWDNDGGGAYFLPYSAGNASTIISGKINTKGAKKLILTYRYVGIPESDACLKVGVEKDGCGVSDTIVVTDFKELKADQTYWYFRTVDLSAYAGENYIRVFFYSKSNDTTNPVFIDQIRVYEAKDNDMALKLFSPSKANAGSQIDNKILLSNWGSNEASAFDVKLFVNGKEAAKKRVDKLPAYEDKYVSLNYQSLATDPNPTSIFATVDYDRDENNDNNTSLTNSINLQKPNYATAENLCAEKSGNDVMLTWNAPSTTSPHETDSLDEYDPFIIDNIGDYTMVDGDESGVYTVSGASYKNQFSPCAFMVFNPAAAGLDLSKLTGWVPYSGSQMLVSWGPEPGYGKTTKKDDWLISPELSGEAQTISFWAKTCNRKNGDELIQILYSTTDKDTASFVNIYADSTITVPESWTKYEVSIPANTKFFAIRAVANSTWALLIDDLEFDSKKLEIVSYNIYRDGKLIGNVPATSTSFTDKDADGASHVYNVSIVYGKGESVLSNDARVEATGIFAASGKGIIIESGNGFLKLSNSEGKNVVVYRNDGVRMFKGQGCRDMIIPLHAGSYIVSIGNEVRNVFVK